MHRNTFYIAQKHFLYCTESKDDIDKDFNSTRLSHARRYSAPWDNKKLNHDEFGSDYEKINNPYWKNSGSRKFITFTNIEKYTIK